MPRLALPRFPWLLVLETDSRAHGRLTAVSLEPRQHRLLLARRVDALGCLDGETWKLCDAFLPSSTWAWGEVPLEGAPDEVGFTVGLDQQTIGCCGDIAGRQVAPGSLIVDRIEAL